MFAHLTSQLTDELQTVQKVLSISESLRDLLVTRQGYLSGLPPHLPDGADDNVKAAQALSRLTMEAPEKLDWQIYDHCAAVTRIYAAYDRFVSELVTEYLDLLPRLYFKYSDLPPSITKQHRLGIGNILRKLGDRGPYKKLDERTVVAQLAAGLSGTEGYALIVDAFFIERQNLRFETLGRLFGDLGFKNCGRYINKHPAVTEFIKQARADTSSPERELNDFIEYRNEAAHKKVDNLLSKDQLGTIARFIVVLGIALANMVEEAILDRHITLAHYSVLLTISETHYDGHVVIGTPYPGVTLKVGDGIIIFAGDNCRSAVLEGIQVQGRPTDEVICDGATEVGLRLSKRASMPGELRRLEIPEEAPKQTLLQLEDSIPAMADAPETDLIDVLEEEASRSDDPNEHPAIE